MVLMGTMSCIGHAKVPFLGIYILNHEWLAFVFARIVIQMLAIFSHHCYPFFANIGDQMLAILSWRLEFLYYYYYY